MTEQSTPRDEQPRDEPVVRTESWPCDQSAQLELSLDAGRIDVSLDRESTTVEVELRVDAERVGGWTKGLSGLLNWLGESTGPSGSIRIGGREISLGGRDFPFPGPHFDLGELGGLDLAAEAVRAAEMYWTESSRHLVVRSTSGLPMRLVPLAITVRAPEASRLTLHAGPGSITVTGQAGPTEVRAGSGDVELDAVAGELRLSTGSGAATVHAVSGRAKAKTGSGALKLDVLGGSATVSAGSGDVRLGAVQADVRARTGSGDLTIDDAERGQLSLTTGSGDLHVGVHAGVTAELDLASGSGSARSELDVSDIAPADGPTALRIHGRTGSGDVLVTRALSTTGAAG
jgi:hypothetical protein